jgi:hypothetical protein
MLLNAHGCLTGLQMPLFDPDAELQELHRQNLLKRLSDAAAIGTPVFVTTTVRSSGRVHARDIAALHLGSEWIRPSDTSSAREWPCAS